MFYVISFLFSAWPFLYVLYFVYCVTYLVCPVWYTSSCVLYPICPVLFVQLICSVLCVLSCVSCPVFPILYFLSCVSCPVFPILCFLSCVSCPVFPILVVLQYVFRFYSLSGMFCSVRCIKSSVFYNLCCPVQRVLFFPVLSYVSIVLSYVY